MDHPQATRTIGAPATSPLSAPADVRASWAAFVGWMRRDRIEAVIALVTGVAFVALFWQPILLLADAWWNDPDAGHGLLLVPVALWLAFAKGIAPEARGQRLLGGLLLLAAVCIRVGAGTAVGYTLTRLALVPAVIGLVVYYAGMAQVRRWWLPLSLFVLSVPLPFFLLSAATTTLQLRASEIGAALLETRKIPVLLDGNVIRLPGHELFVTEACSGLRSLVSLISVAVLMGGLLLQRVWMRLALVLSAVAVAVLVNGIRVFLTGFLVLFVDPAMGEGFMHYSEGMLLFLFSMSILFVVVQVAVRVERRLGHDPTPARAAEVSLA